MRQNGQYHGKFHVGVSIKMGRKMMMCIMQAQISELCMDTRPCGGVAEHVHYYLVPYVPGIRQWATT